MCGGHSYAYSVTIILLVSPIHCHLHTETSTILVTPLFVTRHKKDDQKSKPGVPKCNILIEIEIVKNVYLFQSYVNVLMLLLSIIILSC